MTDVTQILRLMETGDAGAPGQLLPLGYEALRKLVLKMAQESPGQSL